MLYFAVFCLRRLIRNFANIWRRLWYHSTPCLWCISYKSKRYIRYECWKIMQFSFYTVRYQVRYRTVWSFIFVIWELVTVTNLWYRYHTKIGIRKLKIAIIFLLFPFFSFCSKMDVYLHRSLVITRNRMVSYCSVFLWSRIGHNQLYGEVVFVP